MNSLKIKVCGITREDDALAAIDLGVAMLGLNFYPGSPRCITLQQAQAIAHAVAGRAQLVGVFVNMNVAEILRIARAVPLDAVQLHGDESHRECEEIAQEFDVIRALKVDGEFSAERAAEFACCCSVLLDTPSAGHGGSGESFDWASVEWKSLRSTLRTAKLFLAGGLHAGNVAAAIAIVQPDVVDVCSGVESAKGIKSLMQMGKFVAAVRAAERQER
jgi:phosphoribosylanthranilate isomerase